MIELPELPFARDGLEPHISKTTIDFHYGKHHKAYVDNLNKLIKDTIYEGKDLEYIIRNSSGPTYNNAAQVWNHTFFWNCLTSNSKPIESKSKIKEAINQTFGSFKKFKEEFVGVASKHFGSGWVWLVKDEKKIRIVATKDAKEPLSMELIPLLVCDVWEHSYYLDYQNDRSKYLEAFFSVINWDFVEKNFANK